MKHIQTITAWSGFPTASREALLTMLREKFQVLALQDRFTEARDLLLMTHLQERVSTTGVETMILFNRAMTQLGLAAFRSGLMVYAHNCLDDLVNTGSRNGVLRVLLGQGSDATHDQRPGEEEMRVNEERRKLPAHMVDMSVWNDE